MRVDIPLEIDLGPLAWIKDEVSQALGRARKAIEAMLGAAPSSRDHAQRAQAELHQVSGAFELIGIEGLAIYTKEVERHLKTLAEAGTDENSQQVVAAVERAVRRLSSHLEEVFCGSPCKPTLLSREYAILHRLRGSEAGAADLFFPDLNRKPPPLEDAVAVPPERLPSYLQVARRGYERGLLQWLKGDPGGLAVMREQISAIERAFPLPAQRSFWWTVLALLHALEEQSVVASVGVKQLAGRIDLQIRRFVEGSTKISDRLRREVLFHIGRAVSERKEVKDVQALYELDRLLPGAGVSLRSGVDYVALRPAIDALAETVQTIRNSWQRVITGHNEAREPLRKECVSASQQADKLQRPQLANLLSTMAQELPSVAKEAIPDKFAVEFSAALLFIETALKNFAANPAEFEAEAGVLVDQLQAAARGLDAQIDLRVTPAITRRAQERESYRALAAEVREILVYVESAIDAWVRSDAVPELDALRTKLNQVSGVFLVTDQSRAAQLVREIDTLVARLDGSAPAAAQADAIASVADALARLGFYVDAKQQQPNVDLSYLLDESRPGVPRPESDGVQPEAEPVTSVESEVSRQRRQLADLVEQWRANPGDAVTRGKVESTLIRLLDDAKLLGNAELVSATRDALRALEPTTASSSDAEAIALAQTVVAGDVVPVPEVSSQTQALLAKGAPERDDALVEIYLEEAAQIVEGLGPHLERLRKDPRDREALVAIRRAFHTLKGSGRMVGLREMGDAAWDVERHLNSLIQNEASPTAADIELINTARYSFDDWIRASKVNYSDFGIDRSALNAALRKVRAEISVPTAQVPGSTSQPENAIGANAVVAKVRAATFGNSGIDPTAASQQPTKTPEVVSLHDALSASDLEHEPSASSPEYLLEPTATAAQHDVLGFDTDSKSLSEQTVPDWPAFEASASSSSDAKVSSPAAVDFRSESDNFTPLGIDTLTGPFPTDEPTIAETTHGVSTAPMGSALPEGLRAIVTSEAEGHLRVLTNEVERMQFEPNARPTEEMIRAAHTLKGMHLSVGLNDIGELAGSLEASLIALRNRPANDAALPAIATAVSALQSLCRCVRDGVAPEPADLDSVAMARDLLGQLREGATQLTAESLLQNTTGPDTVMRFGSPSENASVESVAPVDAVDRMPAAAPAPERPSWAPTIASGTPAANQITVTPSEATTAREGPAPSLSSTVTTVAGVAEAAAATVADSGANPPSAAAVADAGPRAGEPTKAEPAAAPTPIIAEAKLAASSEISAKGTSLPIPQGTRVDPLAGIRDDIDPTVLGIFLEEAHELFPTASAQLRQWRSAPGDVAAALALKRTVHTIKGSARMAGAMRLGELAHRLESRLESVEFSRTLDARTFDTLEADLDGIAYLLDRLEKGETNSVLPGFESVAEPVLPTIDAGVTEPAAIRSIAAAADVPVAAVVSDPQLETIKPFEGAGVPTAQPEAAVSEQVMPAQRGERADVLRWLQSENAAQAQMLRVRSDAIERLADETGEVSISRARMEAELKTLRAHLNELTSSVTRLRAQVREIEIQAETQIQSRLSQVQETDSTFDPLEFDRFTRFQELTRSLAEGVNDVATVHQSIVSNLDTTDAALNAQGRIVRSLQNQLQAIRTVAFNSLRERLYRVLRQTARELGKRANLEIVGGNLSLDRSVLERLAPLIEHLLRNALAHGIESPEKRVAANKSETGEITLALRQQGNLVEIVMTDDGRGFDLPAIRSKAIAQGLLRSDDALTPQQIIECIFVPGFTTANEVTSVSGRGVGMDVVRTELAAIGGRVDAHYEPNQGARFVLTVPLTLSVLNAVMLRIGHNRYAIPASMVETVKALRAAEWNAARASGVMQHGRETIPFVSIHAALEEEIVARDEPTNQVVVVRSGAEVIALDVDGVIGGQEVVLKRMGPQLSRVSGLLGVTLMGDGEIVLLYNPIALYRSARTKPATTLTEAAPGALAKASEAQVAATSGSVEAARQGVVVPIRPSVGVAQDAEKPLIMVVDDSLTVRKITTRFLEREGFRAISAKDGMEALTLLSDHRPAVILLDIEMPRMDGFEFTRAARGDAALRNIPIIMITSRTAEKHRNLAIELGVNVYLGKPYQDEELLKHIDSFVKRPALAH